MKETPKVEDPDRQALGRQGDNWTSEKIGGGRTGRKHRLLDREEVNDGEMDD